MECFMPRYSMLLAAITASLAGLAAADAQQPQHPCAVIRQVCLQAGFVPNGARAGEGLVIDCIRPIMQGTPQPKRATKTLPAVDSVLIEACKARNPNFGTANAQGPRNRQPQAAPGTAPQVAPPPGAPNEEAPPQEEPAPPKQ
jgi:hypothetical protein